MGAHCPRPRRTDLREFPLSTENLLGKEGDGFKICMWQLNQTRLNCAAGALAWPARASEAAVNYCNQRDQFGQKIGEFQMNQELIAQMVVQEEAARLLVYRAPPGSPTREKPNNLETSIAKYTAAEAADHAADAAMKILGAYGYSTEFPVGALLPRRQVLPDRRRLIERPEDDHRPGRARVSEGEPVTAGLAGSYKDGQMNSCGFPPKGSGSTRTRMPYTSSIVFSVRHFVGIRRDRFFRRAASPGAERRARRG